jgi:hypothetical protein
MRTAAGVAQVVSAAQVLSACLPTGPEFKPPYRRERERKKDPACFATHSLVGETDK